MGANTISPCPFVYDHETRLHLSAAMVHHATDDLWTFSVFGVPYFDTANCSHHDHQCGFDSVSAIGLSSFSPNNSALSWSPPAQSPPYCPDPGAEDYLLQPVDVAENDFYGLQNTNLPAGLPTQSRDWQPSDQFTTASDDWLTGGSDTSATSIDLERLGCRTLDSSWKCTFPDCRSSARFYRACDLRKHYRRHVRTFACRYAGCPSSARAAFASSKDRNRHEARHNPSIACAWTGCSRVFSRLDNMKDHLRRVHKIRSGRE